MKRHLKDRQIWVSESLFTLYREKARKERRTLKATIEMALETGIRNK